MRALMMLIAVALPSSVVAAPREFPFTWTTHTAAQGQNSLEGWLTPRLVRTEDYARYDTRVVWTHGVARTLESQLSMDIDIEETSTQLSLDPKLTSLWRWTTWREGAPFAVGGLARTSLGFDLFEVEGRLLVDWQIGRLLMALNGSASRALYWNGRTGINTRLEESLALKYAVSAHAAFGFEGRVKSSWTGRAYAGTAVYVGPVFTFRHQRFWVTLGGLAQVAAHKVDDKSEPNELKDNERFVFHLSVGGDT